MAHHIKIVKLAYHFFAEGIILFLLLFPFFHYAYHWVPYWTYLFVLIGICILFSLYSWFTKLFAWYLVSAPILFLLFIALDFPSLPSGVIVLILTWRYILMRKERYLENEMNYLQWTVLLTTLLVLFYQQNEAIIFLILQFSVLTSGYIISHTLRMDQSSRSASTVGLWRLFGSIAAGGSVILFLIYRYGSIIFYKVWDVVIVNGWNVITDILIFIATIPMYFLEKFGRDFFRDNDNLDQFDPPESSPSDVEPPDASQFDGNSTYLYGAILLVVIGIIIFLSLKVMKNKFNPESANNAELTVLHSKIDQIPAKNAVKRMAANFFKKPNHPVRKIVFQFERKAEKSDKGRKPFETIQEWFKRIDLKVEMDVYEKVRYGSGNVNEQEIEKLRHALKSWNG